MKRYGSRLSILMVMLIALNVVPAFAKRIDKTYTVRKNQIIFKAEVDMPQTMSGIPLIIQPKQWSIETVVVVFYEGKDVQIMESAYDEPDDLKTILLECDGVTSTLGANGDWTYRADVNVRDDLLSNSIKVYEPESTTVPGLAAQEAVQMVRDRALGLGLEPGAVFRLKAVDQDWWRAEYANLYASYEGFEGLQAYFVAPDDYVPPQVGYWMRMELCLDGIPLMRELYLSKKSNEYVNTSLLDAYVTSRGIELFETVNTVYEIVERKEAQTALTLEQALEAFLKRYEKLAVSDPVVVQRIAYEYVPTYIKGNSTQFEARPAWCFYTEGTGNTLDVQDYTAIYLDALTGKEIT